MASEAEGPINTIGPMLEMCPVQALHTRTNIPVPVIASSLTTVNMSTLQSLLLMVACPTNACTWSVSQLQYLLEAVLHTPRPRPLIESLRSSHLCHSHVLFYYCSIAVLRARNLILFLQHAVHKSSRASKNSNPRTCFPQSIMLVWTSKCAS